VPISMSFSNTPITFPIAWNNSKLDGVAGRLTNIEALYLHFLSTFSGTHFVPPRTYQASLGWTFLKAGDKNRSPAPRRQTLVR
jgi:hypothetical protein